MCQSALVSRQSSIVNALRRFPPTPAEGPPAAPRRTAWSALRESRDRISRIDSASATKPAAARRSIARTRDSPGMSRSGSSLRPPISAMALAASDVSFLSDEQPFQPRLGPVGRDDRRHRRRRPASAHRTGRGPTGSWRCLGPSRCASAASHPASPARRQPAVRGWRAGARPRAAPARSRAAAACPPGHRARSRSADTGLAAGRPSARPPPVATGRSTRPGTAGRTAKARPST